MTNTYMERFIVAGAVALAAGCSAAQEIGEANDKGDVPSFEDEEGDVSSLENDEGDISFLQQAIGEASCATATPNAAASVTFGGRGAVFGSRAVSGGAYLSTAAGCANSDILGIKATSVIGGSLALSVSLSFSRTGLTLAQQVAECALTSFKVSHFKNGVNRFQTVGTTGAGFAVLQTVESGIPVVRNSRCNNGINVNWSVPRAGSPVVPDGSRSSSVSGKTIFIRSGMPLAADKGTLVVQARDRTGALIGYDFRIDPVSP